MTKVSRRIIGLCAYICTIIWLRNAPEVVAAAGPSSTWSILLPLILLTTICLAGISMLGFRLAYTRKLRKGLDLRALVHVVIMLTLSLVVLQSVLLLMLVGSRVAALHFVRDYVVSRDENGPHRIENLQNAEHYSRFLFRVDATTVDAIWITKDMTFSHIVGVRASNNDEWRLMVTADVGEAGIIPLPLLGLLCPSSYRLDQIHEYTQGNGVGDS